MSQLCLRSAYLHEGNALAASGRDEEAREVYKKVLPMLENEPRCGRLDWERSSIYVNIGNTYSRTGDYNNANEQYNIAEQLGKDHVDAVDGNKIDGMGIMIVAMRARAFALKKAGREEEAKTRLRDVLEMQAKLNIEEAKNKAKEKEVMVGGVSAPEESVVGEKQPDTIVEKQVNGQTVTDNNNKDAEQQQQQHPTTTGQEVTVA